MQKGLIMKAEGIIMKEDKKCYYLSIEQIPPMGETHLQCINDECEYYLPSKSLFYLDFKLCLNAKSCNSSYVSFVIYI
jgi:hypothetical protein